MDRKNHHKTKGRKLIYRGSRSPIGLDIGSAQLKVVQLQQKAGNLSLLSLAVMPTPAGIYSDGRVSDPEKLSFKLRQLKNKLHLKGNMVNLCLGPEAHYLRLIELPPLSKKDLQKTLPWEIEKHFPLKASQAVYDCCPLANIKATGNGSIKYILVAAEAETAAALTGAVEKAGFKPLSLEVNPLSLLRFEALCQNSNPQNTDSSGKALLDIGYRSSTLMLAGKGMLQYYRHLRIGVFDFIKEASSVKDLNSKKALCHIFKADPLAAGNTLNSAGQLAEQINGSISYYLEQSGSGRIEPQLLAASGGGAVIPGLTDFLHRELSIRVELQQLPSNSNFKSGNRAKATQANPAIFATAFGLALRGWLR